MSKYMVQLVDLLKKFENNEVVKNISIDIEKGEFLTLLGPSGCGKTTTLRMIAGFEEPTSGRILLDGEDVSYKQPYERDVNTVFQSYALFPHMNIYDNIAFGLKIKKMSKDLIKEKVLAALKLVQLEGFEKRNPSQLSGGQKQRIAIARAIVNSPKVLLFDEPLGALDLKLRKQMQVELKHLQKHLGITFIYVTHDQEEALTMSDRIAVMNAGTIEQIGNPNEIYERPRSRFVADFIGETNIFEASVQDVKMNEKEAILKLEGNDIKIIDKDISADLKAGDNIFIAVRPERMKLNYSQVENKNTLKGRVKERIYVGSIHKTVVYLDGGKEVIINEPAGSALELENKDKDVFVSWEYSQGVMIKR